MKRKLRMYLPFTLNELKRQMAYKGAFYLFVFIELFSSFIAYFLWMAIYGSSDQGTLGGLTQNEMVVYVFMTHIATQIAMISIDDWIADDVEAGTVAMNLIKPIDYRTSLLARAFGDLIYHFMIPSVFVWIGVELYRIYGLGMAFTGWKTIFIFLCSCIMSFFIYTLFDFCFGMIAFLTSYSFGLFMAKTALLSFLTGQLIPLSFFPGPVQKLFEFLPFSSMIYTPVMIYLGKYSVEQLVFVLAKQAIWIVILYAAGSFGWKKITKRMVILGG